MTEALGRAALRSIEAESLSETLHLLGTFAPAAIVFDVDMADGPLLLRILARSRDTQDIPRLVVSRSPDLLAILAIGAHAMINAPLDERDLRPTLERIIARARKPPAAPPRRVAPPHLRLV